MVKHSYDDLIITVGAVVLGLGLLQFLEGFNEAYAYAATPCAAACNPFKNSPATYATCCKQHAATAAAPKPPIRPAPAAHPPIRPAAGPLTTFQKANPLPVTKSTVQKPKTADQLHQGQVTFADYILPDSGPLSTFKPRRPAQQPQNVTNNNYYVNGGQSPPPSYAPSGGDEGCGKTTKYEDHNHGCRDESPDDWVQNSNSFEYSGTFKIPNARDQLTFEFAGKPHTSGNSRDGYKVAFDESATGGVFLWKQVGEKYKGPFTRFPYSVKPGQVVTIKIAKQNIGPESNPIGVEIRAYADGTQIGKWRDMDSNRLAGIIPYYAIPGSRYGYRHDGLNGTTTSCPDNKSTGPSVYCGLGTPMQIRTLPNLSA